MSDWNGFGDLDLSSVELDDRPQYAPILGVGTYNVTCNDAKIETIEGTTNKKMVLNFVDEGGTGEIRANLNIVHTSSQAQEIARRQLKSFLVCSNHPTPDNPGDVESCKGLKCEIKVGKAKPWTNKKGEVVEGVEVKYFNPLAGTENNSSGNDKLDDDIPF
tara:strand:- start:3325 stop:3807 length:483 start_codon:yes stop_codon:yes gene_type:complete